jgi:hypothetical protein
MVHALEEIHRVLVPGAVLLDIRPVADRWPVEVTSGGGFTETGRLEDLADQLNADAASDEAMREAERRGWFQRGQEEFFPFFYTWDTPNQMEEYLAEEWADFAELGEDTKKTTRSAWAISDADSRVRVRVKVLISRWRAV